MTIPGLRHPSACDGFSVLELLIAIAILALAGAVVMPSLLRPSDHMRLRTTAQDLANAIRLTRSAAIARNNQMVLIVDLEGHTFESPVVPRRSFAASIAAELKIAEPERITPSRGGFRFFPDGSSTGGEIVMSLNAEQLKLCVHWLNGQARQGSAC